MAFSEEQLKLLEAAALKPAGVRHLHQAVKTVAPDYPEPPVVEAEDRAMKLIDERLKPVEEENKRLRDELAKQQADKSWQEQLSSVKKELGWGEKQLSAFLKDFGERYKEPGGAVSLTTLAKAYEHENAPLVPTQSSQSIGRFWGAMGDTEKEWRSSVKDPNSDFMKAVRSGNQRKKKEIKNKWWNQAAQEYQELRSGT